MRLEAVIGGNTGMADDTRDLVIALRQDVKHFGETLNAHMAETRTGRQEIKDDIEKVASKVHDLDTVFQQVQGAGKLAGLAKPVLYPILTTLGSLTGLKWLGFIR